MSSFGRRLRLERLESRETPAVVASYTPTTLMLSGIPSGDLTIQHVGAVSNNFEVLDGLKSLGTFAVNNLRIQTPSRPGDIRIDLNSSAGQGVIPGNIYIDLGLGSTDKNILTLESVDVFDSAAFPTGVIGGTLQIVNGNGRESIQIGHVGDNPSSSPAPVTIFGNVQANLRTSGNVFGDTLDVDDGTIIYGSVYATQADGVNIGRQLVGASGTVVGGSVIVNTQGLGSGTGSFFNVYGTVYGSVAQYGTTRSDSFNLDVADFNVGGIVYGSVSANLGNGGLYGNNFQLNANTQVLGPVSVVSGIETDPLGQDLFTFAGDIYSTTNVYMGGGDNLLIMYPSGNQLGAFYATGGGGGNAANDVTLSGTFFADINLNLGFGVDSVLLDGYYGGAKVNVTATGSTSSVTYDALLGSLPYLTVNFGSGANTFTWGTTNMVTPNANITGAKITAPLFVVSNTYNTNGFTFGPELTLVNFP